MIMSSLKITAFPFIMKGRHAKQGRSKMEEWRDRAGRYDLTGKPLTGALISSAERNIETIERTFGFTLGAGDSLEDLIDTAVVADVLCLLLPPLNALNDLDRANGAFPKDRLLIFVCALWFFTTVIPRLEAEGNALDISRVSDQIGAVLFAPYGEENATGLVKIGIQYWKELGAHAPTSVVEWHRSFAQMIFIHYELMINTNIDLGDVNLDETIGKMVTVFLSMKFVLPETN
jgi:hypothetical protein